MNAHYDQWGREVYGGHQVVVSYIPLRNPFQEQRYLHYTRSMKRKSRPLTKVLKFVAGILLPSYGLRKVMEMIDRRYFLREMEWQQLQRALYPRPRIVIQRSPEEQSRMFEQSRRLEQARQPDSQKDLQTRMMEEISARWKELSKLRDQVEIYAEKRAEQRLQTKKEEKVLSGEKKKIDEKTEELMRKDPKFAEFVKMARERKARLLKERTKREKERLESMSPEEQTIYKLEKELKRQREDLEFEKGISKLFQMKGDYKNYAERLKKVQELAKSVKSLEEKLELKKLEMEPKVAEEKNGSKRSEAKTRAQQTISKELVVQKASRMEKLLAKMAATKDPKLRREIERRLQDEISSLKQMHKQQNEKKQTKTEAKTNRKTRVRKGTARVNDRVLAR